MEVFTDMSKYSYEAKIYSVDRKYEKVFIDENFLKAINECEHICSMTHMTKEVILDTENKFLPLKPFAKSLMLETKGGSVVSTMTVEDFFLLLDLGKRIDISDRFLGKKKQIELTYATVEDEIQDIITNIAETTK